jgi:hypothetical protein
MTAHDITRSTWAAKRAPNRRRDGGYGALILNPGRAPSTGRASSPNGFEFFEAEIGRGFSKTMGPIRFELDDTYGQFAEILCQSGMVR